MQETLSLYEFNTTDGLITDLFESGDAPRLGVAPIGIYHALRWLSLRSQDGGASKAELSAICSMTEPSIERHLSRLEDFGYVRRFRLRGHGSRFFPASPSFVQNEAQR